MAHKYGHPLDNRKIAPQQPRPQQHGAAHHTKSVRSPNVADSVQPPGKPPRKRPNT